jgi:hypothetical protein
LTISGFKARMNKVYEIPLAFALVLAVVKGAIMGQL